MRNYREAEEELLGLFSSSLGVKGQSYDPDRSGVFDVNALHLALRQDDYREEVAAYVGYGVTFNQCTAATRLVLWHAFDPSLPVNDFLCACFGSPRNARLAPHCVAAHQAYEKTHKVTEVTRALLATFLEAQGKSKTPNKRLRDAIQHETDRVLETALADYDEHRRARIAMKREERARYYQELLAVLEPA